MRAQQWRGLDFYDQNRTDRVLVIGAGHIGSYITYYLAKLGVKDITVVDFDYVEPHNLPHQFLAESLVEGVEEDAKILKVDILKGTIDFMVRNNNVRYIASKIEDAYDEIANGKNPFPQVIFSCVDSMAVRRWIYEKFVICPLIIDVRTGGQFVNVYAIRTALKDECEFYESSLHTDAEAAVLPCTGTAIIDVAAAASAEAVNRFRLWTNNRLAIQHSFDDYSIGIHSPMKFKSLQVEIHPEKRDPDDPIFLNDDADLEFDNIQLSDEEENEEDNG